MVYVYILLLYVIELFSSEWHSFYFASLRKYKLPMSRIIPFPKRNDLSNVQDFPPGSQVLAVYPGTTALYKATVVNGHRKVTILSFSLLEQKLLFIAFEFQYSIDSYTSFWKCLWVLHESNYFLVILHIVVFYQLFQNIFRGRRMSKYIILCHLILTVYNFWKDCTVNFP